MGLLETGSVFGPYKVCQAQDTIHFSISVFLLRNLQVAIKFIRLHNNADADREKMEFRLTREIAIWKGLEHPNIVPFLGTIRDATIGMVAPWMGNGNLHDYLWTGYLTDIDKLRLVSTPFPSSSDLTKM